MVLGFPHIGQQVNAIAIPLKSAGKEDVSFRPALTHLRQEWEQVVGISSRPADGYFLVGEYLSGIRWKNYPESLRDAFSESVAGIADAIQQPIRYAGPGQYSFFTQPSRWQKIQVQSSSVVCLPETQPTDGALLSALNYGIASVSYPFGLRRYVFMNGACSPKPRPGWNVALCMDCLQIAQKTADL